MFALHARLLLLFILSLQTLSNPKCLVLPPDGENYTEYDFHRTQKPTIL